MFGLPSIYLFLVPKGNPPDQNNNGIIDSIDDTLGLIEELKLKGYRFNKDIVYREVEGGRHDQTTWGRVMGEFLEWAFKE